MSALRLHVSRPELTPARAHPDDSGLDLRADLSGETGQAQVDGLEIPPGERKLIRTGVTAAVEPGWDLQVRSRSGLALRHGVCVLNSPGTIDASYRGELGVILQNQGSSPFLVRHGDRIAQMVVGRVSLDPPAIVASVDELGTTERGSGGYGSTGQQ